MSRVEIPSKNNQPKTFTIRFTTDASDHRDVHIMAQQMVAMLNSLYPERNYSLNDFYIDGARSKLAELQQLWLNATSTFTGMLAGIAQDEQEIEENAAVQDAIAQYKVEMGTDDDPTEQELIVWLHDKSKPVDGDSQ